MRLELTIIGTADSPPWIILHRPTSEITSISRFTPILLPHHKDHHSLTPSPLVSFEDLTAITRDPSVTSDITLTDNSQKTRKACSREDTRQPHLACQQIPERSRNPPSFFTVTLSIFTPSPELGPVSSTSLLVESPFRFKHSAGRLIAALSTAVTCELAPTTPPGEQKPLPKASNQHTHAVSSPNRQYAVFWAS